MCMPFVSDIIQSTTGRLLDKRLCLYGDLEWWESEHVTIFFELYLYCTESGSDLLYFIDEAPQPLIRPM